MTTLLDVQKESLYKYSKGGKYLVATKQDSTYTLPKKLYDLVKAETKTAFMKKVNELYDCLIHLEQNKLDLQAKEFLNEYEFQVKEQGGLTPLEMYRYFRGCFEDIGNRYSDSEAMLKRYKKI